MSMNGPWWGTWVARQGRKKTNGGHFMDIGLSEPIFRILDELAPAFQRSGYVRQRMGPGTVNVVPHSHYPTKDSRWIAIACTNDKIFARLAEAMERPDLAELWSTLAARKTDPTLLDEIAGPW